MQHVGGLLKLCERPVTRRIRSRTEGSIPTASFAPWTVTPGEPQNSPGVATPPAVVKKSPANGATRPRGMPFGLQEGERGR
jgi:hypothetical protein